MPTLLVEMQDQLEYPGAIPASGVSVSVRLIASLTGETGGFDPDDNITVLGVWRARSDPDGLWSLELRPNEELLPANTVYEATIRPSGRPAEVIYFEVPNSAGPHWVRDHLTSLPSDLPVSGLAAHEASGDPHPGYLTEAVASGTYVALDGDGKQAIGGAKLDEDAYLDTLLGGESLLATLPNFAALAADQADTSPTTVHVVGMGSSVALGPNGALDAANAPSAYFAAQLNAICDPLNRLTITHTNRAVSGSSAYDAVFPDGGGKWDLILAEPLVPKILVISYGMNDGNPAIWNSGPTMPATIAKLRELVTRAQGQGADVVIFTTPHPYSTQNDWTDQGGAFTSFWPNAAFHPGASYAASVVSADPLGAGATIPVSYRHLRWNEAARRVAADLGVLLLDAERYWFEAVADVGEAALYNAGQSVHPNLVGMQRSYHAAVDAFFRALRKTRSHGTAPSKPITTGVLAASVAASAANTSTTSTTYTQVGAVQVTFTVPPSGKVVLRATGAGSVAFAGGGNSLNYALLEGGTLIANTGRALVDSTSGATFEASAVTWVLTGLTPGRSRTFQLGYASNNGVNVTLNRGGLFLPTLTVEAVAA